MSQLDCLWEYQQAELALAALNKEMKSSPAHQKRVKLHKFLTEQKEIIASYEKDVDERTAQVSALEAQLEALLHDYDLENSELEIMLNDEESTAEELTEARKALEKLGTKINSLNRELAKLIEWCDKITASINKTYSKASKAKNDYDAVRTACDAEKDSFAPKIEALTKELEEKKASIPEPLMKKYLAIKKNHPTPIAKVIGGQCSGCFMQLPSVIEKRVATGTSIVQCETCGRLLMI